MSAEGWLLHKSPSGDTSLRLSLFTRDLGLVTCLYRGGRTPKKQAVLQPFLPLWLALDNKRDSYYVRTIESLAPPLELKSRSLFCALYLNELVCYALKSLDPHPQLYDLYEYTLKGLAILTESAAREALLRKFEWFLLDTCGYMLSFMDESDPEKRYQYIPGKGFIVVADGMPGEDIWAIVQGQFIDIRVLKTAKLIMRQAIDHLLNGKELKSRALFSNVIGK